MRIVFLILATALSVSAQQAGTTTPSPTKSAMNHSLEQEILAKEKEVWDLSIRGDLEAYSRLITDDLLVVYSTGYASKADELKDFGRAQTIADQKATKYTSAVKVMLLGDTGIATGNFRSKGTNASGKPLDANERFTDTWVKMPSGKWQCVASHESPLKM